MKKAFSSLFLISGLFLWIGCSNSAAPEEIVVEDDPYIPTNVPEMPTGIANCYVVTTGSTVTIPVTIVNLHKAGTLSDTDLLEDSLVWIDNSNRISSSGVLQNIAVTGVGQLSLLEITAGSAEGNAVVAVTKNKEIIWSWHIWVVKTENMPAEDLSYEPSNPNAVRFMDKNLGAIINTPNNTTNKGMLYQWGRKDPFHNSTSITGNTERTLYDKSGTTAMLKVQRPTDAENNLDLSIRNPKTFYTEVGTSRDWYMGAAGIRHDNLWSSPGKKKTIYDPCPEGWRVPPTGHWNPIAPNNNYRKNYSVWNKLTFTGGQTYGVSFDPAGNVDNTNNVVFYAAAGHRNSWGGNLEATGNHGYYWSASPSGRHAFALLFHNNFCWPTYNHSMYRCAAFSVRCIKE